jgi:hypothetical protein
MEPGRASITPSLNPDSCHADTTDGNAVGVKPTGTVAIFDGLTKLGTSSLDAGAVATFSTSTLAAGAHNITAHYGNDINYLTVTSIAVVFTAR